MRPAHYASFLPPKRGAVERGWGQIGSSHLNEKFSFEQDATVSYSQSTLKIALNMPMENIDINIEV